MTGLYSRIILSCAFGLGKSDVTVQRELPDGTFQELPLFEALRILIEETTGRGFWPFNLLFPELAWWSITPYDRMYERNIQRVKVLLRKFVEDRRADTKNNA